MGHRKASKLQAENASALQPCAALRFRRGAVTSDNSTHESACARPTQNPEQFRLPQRCGRADIGGDDARMFENIAWCAFGKGASIIKHMDAIGKVRHHLEVMLNPDHGNSK